MKNIKAIPLTLILVGLFLGSTVVQASYLTYKFGALKAYRPFNAKIQTSFTYDGDVDASKDSYLQKNYASCAQTQGACMKMYVNAVDSKLIYIRSQDIAAEPFTDGQIKVTIKGNDKQLSCSYKITKESFTAQVKPIWKISPTNAAQCISS